MSTTSAKYLQAHAKTAGPGDARPTALAIVEDEGLVGKLSGRTILITGASSGIGIETARALHATGADLFLAVRNTAQGQKVADEITSQARGNGKITVLELELGDLASVRRCAEEFGKKSKTLNVLVANAGVMACPFTKTKDGFEMQFGTNHLGHFLLFQLLKPILLASSTPEFNSRYVSLSSMGHRITPVLLADPNFEKGGYQEWLAYGSSKSANIHLANEIDRRYGAQGLHATSLHPGGIFTPLQRHLSDEQKAGWASPQINAYMKSPEQGAATTVWAAIGKEWEGAGGKYLEDVRVAPPQDPEKAKEALGLHPGHASHAYDPAAEKALWELSNRLVGFEEK